MIMQYALREETIQPEFNVMISENVYNYLYIVCIYNKTNGNALVTLTESIERVSKDLSYRKNGLEQVDGMPMRRYGIKVYFKFKNDEYDSKPYVLIYRIMIDFDYFGLVNPYTYRKPIQERTGRITIKESQLRYIIRETLRKVLPTT